jgi:hypothetical protein
VPGVAGRLERRRLSRVGAGYRVGMSRWTVIAAACVLPLAGCSLVAAPEPGLDDQQLAEYRAQVDDLNWSFTGLSADHRPAHPAVTVIAAEDWPTEYVACMNAAGFDQYVVLQGAYSVTGDEGMDARPPDELVADYLCNASLEIDGQFESMYNPQQLDYLFDYYQRVLVPCLEVRGLDVLRVPTRGQFVDSWGGWHPYFAVSESQLDGLFGDPTVLQECPPTPAGIPDPGYASLWQQ